MRRLGRIETGSRARLTLAFALASALVPGRVEAAPALRAQVTVYGDFALIGNTQGRDCAPGVPAPVVGTVGACGGQTDDSSPDVAWQSDFPAAGMASANTAVGSSARTTAVLVLPAGAQVVGALLYWSATHGVPPDTSVQVERPGTFLATATATSTVSVMLGGNQHWQSVADVTAIVKQFGSGAYRVSGIDAVAFPGLDTDMAFAGWWMVVIYNVNGATLRRISVYDGLDPVTPGAPVSLTDTGFTIPMKTAGAELGVIGFDGDALVTGDQIFVGGGPLGDAVNPVDDFFNSSRSRLGAPVSVAGDLPQLTGGPASMSQIDLDVADVSGKIVPGQTSVNVLASTTGDVFLLGGVVSAMPTVGPDLSASTKVASAAGGPVIKSGDTVTYTIAATNGGQDTAVGVVLTDALPAGVTFVPGTIQVVAGPNAGAKTDASGDDEAEYDAAKKAVRVRLGTGATAAAGGKLAPGESSTVMFQVTVDAGVKGAIANQALIGATGMLGAPPGIWATDGDGATPGAQATMIDVIGGGGAGGGGGGTSTSTSSATGTGGGGGMGATTSAGGGGGMGPGTSTSTGTGAGGEAATATGVGGSGGGGVTSTGAGGSGGKGGGGIALNDVPIVQGGCVCEAGRGARGGGWAALILIAAGQLRRAGRRRWSGSRRRGVDDVNER